MDMDMIAMVPLAIPTIIERIMYDTAMNDAHAPLRTILSLSYGSSKDDNGGHGNGIPMDVQRVIMMYVLSFESIATVAQRYLDTHMSLFIPSTIPWIVSSPSSSLSLSSMDVFRVPVLPNQQPNTIDDWKAVDTPIAHARHDMAIRVYNMWLAAYQYDHIFFIDTTCSNDTYSNSNMRSGEVIWHMARYYYHGIIHIHTYTPSTILVVDLLRTFV